MSAAEVVVVDTRAANLASMLVALRRLGAEPRVSHEPADVHSARALVLPGVGHFGAVAQRLSQLRLREQLVERIAAGRATLAICLGMQLLCESSDESPDAVGLGILPLRVGRFSSDVRVPQLGWNRVTADADCELLRSGYAYFANSYRLTDAPAGWRTAWSDHGGRFVAALERGRVLACQFHPELSGAWGLSLIERWLAAAQTEAANAGA